MKNKNSCKEKYLIGQMFLTGEPNYRTDISFTPFVLKTVYILRTSQSSISTSEISSELHTCISNVFWASPKECEKSSDTQQIQIWNTFILPVAYSYSFKQSISQSLSHLYNIYIISITCLALSWKLGIHQRIKPSKMSSTRCLYFSGVIQMRKKQQITVSYNQIESEAGRGFRQASSLIEFDSPPVFFASENVSNTPSTSCPRQRLIFDVAIILYTHNHSPIYLIISFPQLRL